MGESRGKMLARLKAQRRKAGIGEFSRKGKSSSTKRRSGTVAKKKFRRSGGSGGFGSLKSIAKDVLVGAVVGTVVNSVATSRLGAQNAQIAGAAVAAGSTKVVKGGSWIVRGAAGWFGPQIAANLNINLGTMGGSVGGSVLY